MRNPCVYMRAERRGCALFLPPRAKTQKNHPRTLWINTLAQRVIHRFSPQLEPTYSVDRTDVPFMVILLIKILL